MSPLQVHTMHKLITSFIIFETDPLLSSLLSGLSIQESETVSGVAGIEAMTKGSLSTDQKSPR